MLKKINKSIVIILTIFLSLVAVGNTIAFANLHVENKERKNTHTLSESLENGIYEIVYEYTKNNKKYKRIDQAYKDFKETKSQVYELIDNQYVKIETQYTYIDDSNKMKVYIDSEINQDKFWDINLNDKSSNNNKIISYANNYDWVTEETEYTRFYEDAYHRFYINSTYVEWRC